MLRLFSVNPAWTGQGSSDFHHVVAAVDEVDAARKVTKIKDFKSKRKGLPTHFYVSKVYTPEEFEADHDLVTFDDDEEEIEETPYSAFSNMLHLAKKVIL